MREWEPAGTENFISGRRLPNANQAQGTLVTNSKSVTWTAYHDGTLTFSLPGVPRRLMDAVEALANHLVPDFEESRRE